ncbi:hypothetical protein UFOVP704_68 [uncultured Caudovirales phage]|uniref:YubB ferredoxin-like domain-containing protein n=1 Tax=uncultured Caudovirales phage TaxID=2100421 RepID=A0A6J5NHL5_9CAUD|nr:hypothetical protein UFOVP704_68 [uncultured Caudovirales phage]
MPNWCMNELTITGPADKVSAWATLHTTKYETSTSVLDFNKSVPEPVDEDGNCNIRWQYKNWGTKWGACDTCYLQYDEGHVTIAFDTAWGPPDEWVSNMYEQFPDLSFSLRYAEPGMGFAGNIWADKEGYRSEHREGDDLEDDDYHLMGTEICEECKNWEPNCTCE